MERYGREGEYLGPDTHIGAEAIIRDRAGWWQDEGNERVYLFNTTGMREALAGFDFQPALGILQEVGALPSADATGRRSISTTIGGWKGRVYTVRPGKLEVPHGP